MSLLIKYLWLFPLAIHGAYVAATMSYFPAELGSEMQSVTPRTYFFAEWAAIVLGSNGLLVSVWLGMPFFSDRMLGVPNREHWLHPDHKDELIDRLQKMMESILLLANVFFAGIYQWVYQSNVAFPAMRLPLWVIAVAFIGLPVVLIVVYMLGTLRGLKNIPPS